MKAAALACLLLAAVPGRVTPVPVAGLDGATIGQSGEQLQLRLPGGARVMLSRDGYCKPCLLYEAQRVPGGPPDALAMVSMHASRPSTPSGFCGAGDETVLHLLVREPRWHEAVSLRLDSCFQTTEANEAPHWDGPVLSLLRWSATPLGTVRHTWRFGPGSQVTRLEPPP